jgi:hypothetical protein
MEAEEIARFKVYAEHCRDIQVDFTVAPSLALEVVAEIERLEGQVRLRHAAYLEGAGRIAQLEETVKGLEPALCYIAQGLNSLDTNAKGHDLAWRWLCLDQRLQKIYLDRARDLVAKWWAREQELETKRSRP